MEIVGQDLEAESSVSTVMGIREILGRVSQETEVKTEVKILPNEHKGLTLWSE
jgi:hypothetical protein